MKAAAMVEIAQIRYAHSDLEMHGQTWES